MAGDTKEEEPEATFSVAELAHFLGITTRRVRQLRENGELIARAPGRIDAPHAINAHLGKRVLGRDVAPHVDKFELAAVGWLIGHRATGVGVEELAAWHRAAARWGLTEAEANAAIMNAGELLGEQCPRFDLDPARAKRKRTRE